MADPWAWRSDASAPAPDLLAPRGPQPEAREGPARTLKQVLFDAIYGGLGGTPANRGLAEALTGAADLATLGIPTGIDQGARDVAAGKGPGALAMALVPGARGIGAAENALARGIRAYHGSPHSFDRFDLSKIGTGEGAQAYGHGLYFAENEGVARAYRDNLAGHDWGAKIPSRMVGGVDVASDVTRALERANGDPARARQILLQDQARFAGTGSDDVNAAAVRLFDEVAPSLAPRPRGHMYEVNINARPDDFLDWDKPLSQQSGAIRAAMSDLGIKTSPAGASREFDDALLAALSGKDVKLPATPTDPRGQDAVRELYAKRGSSWLNTNAEAEAVVSKQMREAGIPGIRYLDQGSRGAGEGSRNYVVFDDALVQILRKYGLLPAAVGVGAYGAGGAGDANAAPAAP